MLIGPLNAAIARRKRQFEMLQPQAEALSKKIQRLQQALYKIEAKRSQLEQEAQELKRELLAQNSPSKSLSKAQALKILNSMSQEQLDKLIKEMTE